jgi:hypothetical protein
VGGGPVRHRLSRRTLLLTLGAVPLAACSPANGASPSESPTKPPTGDVPWIVWQLTGGREMAGVRALRPARLVVFGDGETIADATYRARLDMTELKTLVARLVTVLKTPDVAKRRSTFVSYVDAQTTVLKVWTEHGTLSASADGLDEYRDQKTYADALYDARDRLGEVYKQVAVTAQPYLADRVRMVTEKAPSAASGDGAKAWPAELAMPTAADPTSADVHGADLDGQPARDVVRLLTRDLDGRGAWPTYKTTDGTLVQASWRYLLPNE